MCPGGLVGERGGEEVKRGGERGETDRGGEKGGGRGKGAEQGRCIEYGRRVGGD